MCSRCTLLRLFSRALSLLKPVLLHKLPSLFFPLSVTMYEERDLKLYFTSFKIVRIDVALFASIDFRVGTSLAIIGLEGQLDLPPVIISLFVFQ
jgi:hypothetical protein